MIIKKEGTEFVYDGKVYTIGASVIATDSSEYKGLFGRITEIRTGKDKETENEEPDVYCTFDPPVLPCEVEALEKTFSELFHEEKKIEDISLDIVIMAPEMIEPLDSPALKKEIITVYAVESDWSINGDNDYFIQLFADYNRAKKTFNDDLLDDLTNGCSKSWVDDEDYVTDIGEDFFECWLDGQYNDSHFRISISKRELHF